MWLIYVFLLVAGGLAASYVVRNVWFHSLSQFPGPRLWASCQLPAAWRMVQGRFWQDLIELHRRYGDIVRVSPNQLSIISRTAWRDIYGHHARGQQGRFLRDHQFYTKSLNGSPHILGSNGEIHSRYRRILSHAFSERAMKEQEALIHSYISLLVQRLRDKATHLGEKSDRAKIDMTKWYNWTTFDVVGALSYSESFNMLQNSAYHPWVSFIFSSSKLNVILKARDRVEYPFRKLVDWFIPNDLPEKAKSNLMMTQSRVERRLRENSEEPDFMSYILRYTGEDKGLSFDEIVANMGVLTLAGSETSSTLLTGLTYYLLKNQTKLEKLVHEIRSTFPSAEDITFDAAKSLTYLGAVIKEGMRIYPPTPGGLFRVSPQGGQHVSDHFIPESTSVYVPFLAAYQYPPYWTRADEFIPERWIHDYPGNEFATDYKSMLQPFSLGPQDCIGKNLANMELRLIMCQIFWNFDLELCPESVDWVANQKVFTFWEKPPLMVTVRDRTLGLTRGSKDGAGRARRLPLIIEP